ncbi:unnamed protein product [Caenorhabditis brenneri]
MSLNHGAVLYNALFELFKIPIRQIKMDLNGVAVETHRNWINLFNETLSAAGQRDEELAYGRDPQNAIAAKECANCTNKLRKQINGNVLQPYVLPHFSQCRCSKNQPVANPTPEIPEL